MNIPSHEMMTNPLANQQGTFFIISAIMLVVMFGFAAFGMEIGRRIHG